jgi:lysozyme
MEIKSVDQAGIDFIAKEEGCILRPYLDSVGVPTIGIGCTYYPGGIRVKMTDPSITREKAYDLFKAVLHHYETAVWSFTRDDINQNQFNALVSI